ncbi:hypothetical protein ACFQ14_04755 [Pseudahrensia aquimaris]|uniref:DUF2232 domain-containing protein n=1 Tax=Pseudahrensia aquimaris TaxID=744461 RepID=A0ABW3FCU8_9HYPH
MTSRALLIAIVCGLISALMLAAPLRLGGLGAMLFLFAATPVCVSALGFGTKAGVISGLMGAIAFGAFLGPVNGISVFVFSLLPGIWAGHMAGLVSYDDGDANWFPLSTILTRLAFLAAGSVIAIGYINGLNGEGLNAYVNESLTAMMTAAGEQNPNLAVPSQEQIGQSAAQIVGFFPMFAPAFLLITYVWNLSFGARIARANGWMLRPKDDIPSMTGVELGLVGVFAAALLISFFGGTVGLAAKVVAGATGAALMLTGFAVLHDLTRGVAARGLLLGTTYAFTFLTLIPAFFMLILGLVETFTGLRARRGGPPSST